MNYYFFKGNKYWKWNMNGGVLVQNTAINSTKAWPGIPDITSDTTCKINLW